MKKIISIISFALIALTAANAQTQSNSAYFLDGYDFRHEFNPAMPSARSYFSIPVLGTISIATNSNLGISTFLYPTANGNLTTFMNSSVDKNVFLKKLNKNNNIAANVNTSLLSIGFWNKKNGFNMIDLNLKGAASVNLPKDLFAFIKDLGGKETYNINNLGARANVYLELALGRSQRITKDLTVGAKIKFLVGLAKADLNIDHVTAEMTTDRLKLQAYGAGQVYSSGNILKISTDNIAFNDDLFSGNVVGNFIGGYGLAFDLGATYQVIDGLTVSAAILDFGFLNWRKNQSVSANFDWEFTGFDEISFEPESDKSLENQFNNMTSDFGSNLVLQESFGKRANMLAATINLGVEYKMPFWKGLSVGGLYTTRIQGPYSSHEGRLSVNIAAGNAFSVSGSYAIATYGSSFGFALNLHGKGINYFMGTDSIITKYAPVVQGLKIGPPSNNLNIGFYMGMAFNVSKRRDKDFR